MMKTPPLEIDVLIPGVFEHIERWSLHYVPFPEFKGLEQLLDMATLRQFGHRGYEHTLWKLLQTSYSDGEELPVARQLRHLDAGMVCRADPVHLRADIADLILVDTAQLNLSAEDCRMLEDIINAHLAEINGRYSLTVDGIGVMSFPEAADLSTTPISEVAGKGIQALMPQGHDSGQWHRLMNEFQMLLHDTGFNQQRADRGEVAINAIWLWGAGQQSKRGVVNYDQLFSDDVFSQSLAESFQIPVSGLDPGWSSSGTAHRVLLVSTAQLPAVQYDDVANWQAAIETLEETVIHPLLTMLKDHEISRLRLFSCDGRYFQVKPRHRWRQLFRKRRSLVQQALRAT